MNKPLIIGMIIGLLILQVKKVYGYGSTKFDYLFRKYADDPKLAKAIGMVESSLNPNAMGDQGRAHGLMQIWYATAKGHGYTGSAHGLLNPETNIYLACKELNHLTRTYGRSKGIMGYNIGETRLRKGGSNTAYLAKVNKALSRVTIT